MFLFRMCFFEEQNPNNHATRYNDGTYQVGQKIRETIPNSSFREHGRISRNGSSQCSPKGRPKNRSACSPSAMSLTTDQDFRGLPKTPHEWHDCIGPGFRLVSKRLHHEDIVISQVAHTLVFFDRDHFRDGRLQNPNITMRLSATIMVTRAFAGSVDVPIEKPAQSSC